jgi:hypothetical protein
VATEGPAKLFDDRQDLMERCCCGWPPACSPDAGCTGDDAEIEFTFPSIVSEDRSRS